MANDSNLSRRTEAKPSESEGVRQHHRLALGLRVNGQTNPNGAPPDTSNKIAGQKKNW